MTTRAIVPNGDGEGSLGTSTAKWGAVYSSDPASGENSGQVPTTAWVQKLVAEALKTAKKEIYKQAKLDAHPVGSYYWSNDSTSPATLFGGTWEALPAGYTLIAQGSGSDSFGNFTYEAGQKYGERKHQLTPMKCQRISTNKEIGCGQCQPNLTLAATTSREPLPEMPQPTRKERHLKKFGQRRPVVIPPTTIYSL